MTPDTLTPSTPSKGRVRVPAKPDPERTRSVVTDTRYRLTPAYASPGSHHASALDVYLCALELQDVLT